MSTNLGQPESETQPSTAGENPTPDAATPPPEAAGTDAAPTPAPGTTDHDPAPAPIAGRKSRADVAGYEKMLAEAMTPKENDDAGATNDEPQGEPAAGDAPEGEVTAEGEDADAPAGEGDEDVKIPDRVRLGGIPDEDKADINAALILAKGKKIPFAEALARVTGKPVGATPTPPDAAPKPAAVPPAQREAELLKQIADKKAEKKTAAVGLDTAKMFDLDEEIDALKDQLQETRAQSAQAAVQQKQVFKTEAEKSQAQAVDDYPDAAVKDSPLALEMIRIADHMEATGNTLVYSKEAPLKIAQMAANNLGIAPKARAKPNGANGAPSKTSPSAQPKPQAVRREAVVRSNATPAVAPASGAARTTQPGSQPGNGVGKIRTASDYRKEMARLGVVVD